MNTFEIVTTDQVTQLPSIAATSPLTWVIPGVDDGDLRALAWQDAKEAWLKSKYRKSSSDNTVNAYTKDWNQFFRWLGKAPWNVSTRDAESWMAHLEESGSSHGTINRKLAALSSFYEFVANKYTYVSARDQVERSIYIDDNGNPRVNPFRKPDRFKVDGYNHSTPLAVDAVRDCLKAINHQSKLGSRDHALIVTYIYTGRRSQEIGNLHWGDIQPGNQPGRYYYSWHGKGGKSRVDELPPPAYHAICNFLKMNGRFDTIKPGDYIFTPVYADRALRLPNVTHLDANRPISGSMINRIVKNRFADVGIAADLVHTHTLRHTAAHLRYRDGEGEDLMAVSRFLAHSSVAVTQIYLSKQHKPIDTGWTEVEQLLMF